MSTIISRVSQPVKSSSIFFHFNIVFNVSNSIRIFFFFFLVTLASHYCMAFHFQNHRTKKLSSNEIWTMRADTNNFTKKNKCGEIDAQQKALNLHGQDTSDGQMEKCQIKWQVPDRKRGSPFVPIETTMAWPRCASESAFVRRKSSRKKWRERNNDENTR